jgi:hypothetical protein
MSLLGILATYLGVGAVIGELGIAALRRKFNQPITGPGYVALVLLWPLLLVSALFRKGK